MRLRVNEIFYSIQGESSYSGLPFVFVRLSGCNLRCSYCDTKYSYEEGDELSIDDILTKVSTYPVKNAAITGGEPLLQEGCSALINKLIERGYNLLIETNGSQDISKMHPDAIRIVDIKCPGSEEGDSFDMANLTHLRSSDEVKFVITSRDDYDFAKGMTTEHNLTEKCNVIFSPVIISPAQISPAKTNKLSLEDLAGWILEDGLNVRMQIQLHKHIFGDKRGT